MTARWARAIALSVFGLLGLLLGFGIEAGRWTTALLTAMAAARRRHDSQPGAPRARHGGAMNAAPLTPGVQWVMAGILGLLVVASAVTWWLLRRGPAEKYAELAARVKSWWVMVAVFAVAIAIDTRLSIVFFGLVSFLALKEYFSLIPTRRADRRVLFWAYLSIPLQYYWVYRGWYGMFIVFIPVWMVMLISARMVLIGDTRDFLRAVGPFSGA